MKIGAAKAAARYEEMSGENGRSNGVAREEWRGRNGKRRRRERRE